MRSWLVLLLPFACLCARADWVHLKSGKTLQGEVVSQDERYVVVRVLSGEIKLRAEDVESIERQSPQDYKFDLGRQLLVQRRYDRAVTVLEEAYLSDKTAGLAKRKLALGYSEIAQYFQNHNRLGDAREICEKWIKLDASGATPELLVEDAKRILALVTDAEKKLDESISSAHTYAEGSDWDSAISTSRAERAGISRSERRTCA